jgi:hypothetical protein
MPTADWSIAVPGTGWRLVQADYCSRPLSVQRCRVVMTAPMPRDLANTVCLATGMQSWT